MDGKLNQIERYNKYSTYIKERFSKRVQKISLNVGFTCPNRDGSKGIGGCTYCNNKSFNPSYFNIKYNIDEQINNGISKFSTKYPDLEYFAYFQSYTNTYSDVNLLSDMYKQALSHKKVIGLIVGTRPDCISTDVLNLLKDLAESHYVSIEFGIESTLNKTLDRINRCHSYEETIQAFDMCNHKNIDLGGHIILGLPGETKHEMLLHAKKISQLPIKTLKIHQLQIIKHTMMEKEYRSNPSDFALFDIDEYVDFVCEFVSLLRKDIVIERFTSESLNDLLVAPIWNKKNFEIADKISKRLIELDLFQGKHYLNNVSCLGIN